MPETGIDFSAGGWLQVAAWAQAQLDLARRKNDAPGLNHDETQVLRGEIRFIKRLLGLPEEAARARSAGSA